MIGSALSYGDLSELSFVLSFPTAGFKGTPTLTNGTLLFTSNAPVRTFCFEPRMFRLLFSPTFYSVTASFSATVAVSIVFPILVSVLLLERSLPEFSFFFLVTMRRFYAFLELMYRLFDSFRSFLLIRLYLCLFVCLRSISAQLWFERSFCTFLFILLRHFPGFQ